MSLEDQVITALEKLGFAAVYEITSAIYGENATPRNRSNIQQALRGLRNRGLTGIKHEPEMGSYRQWRHFLIKTNMPLSPHPFKRNVRPSETRKTCVVRDGLPGLRQSFTV